MKKQAITLVEIIVSVTILSVILIMLSGVITKKAQNAADTSSGTFACYKDANGNLNQKVRLQDGTIQEKRGIEQCNFTFPSGVDKYTIYVIGGGGGGGKITENSSDYWQEIPGESKRFTLLEKSAQGCVAATNFLPVMSREEGTNDSMQYINNECEGYICAADGINTITFNENKEYANFFDEESLQLAALTNRSLYIKGGVGANDIKGAICATSANLTFGSKFNYLDGKDQYQCSEAATMPLISASPGTFKSGNKYAIAQGGYFSKEHSFDVVSVKPKCKANGLNTKELHEEPTIIEEDEINYSLLKLKTYYSSGGKAGTTITNTSINLAGRTVLISKDQIGNGGTPGQNGQTTNFSDFNMTAWGGAAGENIPGDEYTTTLADAKIIGGENAPNGLASLTDGVYPLSIFRLKYNCKDNLNNSGEMSDYVRNVVLLGVANQEKFAGQGALCSDTLGGCKISKSPDEESYGSGGGGASSMVKYDPFYKFIYTRPNYSTNTREKIINSTYVPVVTKSQASNGMGGAVVIKW